MKTVGRAYSETPRRPVRIYTPRCVDLSRERFRDDTTYLFFTGEPVRHVPHDIRGRAQEAVVRVLKAASLSDLQRKRNYRPKSLIGDRSGQHSIRINDQWRVCFRWTAQGAMEIEVTDYH